MYKARKQDISRPVEHMRPEDLGIGKLFGRIREAVIVADARTQRIVLWNPAATNIFGYSISEALKLNIEKLVPEPLKSQHRAGITRYAETGHGPYIDSLRLLELPALTKSGDEIYVELSLSPIGLAGATDGGRRFVLAIVRDVTERKWAEEALRQNEERFRLLVEGVKDYAIFMLDPEGRVASWNEGAHRIKGYSQQEILGRHFSIFYPEEDRERGKPERALEIAREKGTYEEEGWRVRKDGSRFWASVLITALWDEGGGLRGFAKVTRDITERKALEEQLHHQAFYDPLSGLPNRALFMDRLEHALTRANRRGGRVAVLFVDLDNFKVINDSLGHKAGDQLLMAVAERLKTHLRPEDTAARLGGDEFTILVGDVTSVGEVVQIAERIAEILQPPFTLEEQEVFVTVSTGIALNSSSTQERAEDLLRHADVAMYRAKHKGKARYELFKTKMEAEVQKRLEVENELRRALELEEFRVYFQPMVALESGRIAGVEALVRWEHPKRGLLLPEEFLLIAEETGLIVRIGQWVLREACKQARAWQERSPSAPPLTMSVNLSPRQFFHPELVAEILHETKVDASTLQLEITEGALTTNTARSADDILHSLKDLGVKLAIDDFGVGYSSLSYLKRFPVDFLKIDRSFVSELKQDLNSSAWKDEEIVPAMIDLMHALGLKVVAEGVEAANQMARLRDMRCDLAQGNYLLEPLPGEALGVILAENLTDRG
jgi:diguanylate cyclase (GGDEF)-like protein/PAS domain S-box-containing protein